jgi:(p)ppGpp synthase/HD superfamily hydrolase
MLTSELAEQIARRAHANQFRRDGVTPYIVHPEAVVKKLAGLGNIFMVHNSSDDDVKAAAWLHDVLEDTVLTATTLLDSGIPKHVVDAVVRLTKRGDTSYDFYLAGVRDNEIARKVKVADMLANLGDTPTRNQVVKYARGLLVLLPGWVDHADG